MGKVNRSMVVIVALVAGGYAEGFVKVTQALGLLRYYDTRAAVAIAAKEIVWDIEDKGSMSLSRAESLLRSHASDLAIPVTSSGVPLDAYETRMRYAWQIGAKRIRAVCTSAGPDRRLGTWDDIVGEYDVSQ